MLHFMKIDDQIFFHVFFIYVYAHLYVHVYTYMNTESATSLQYLLFF